MRGGVNHERRLYPYEDEKILSCMMALLLVCSLPVSAFADTWYLDEGSITVNATESGQTVSQGETSKNDDAPVITQHDSETSTTNTVTITADAGAAANVTLDGVNIDVSGTGDIWKNDPGEAAVQITGNGDVTLELDGTNTVRSGSGRAGVEKNTTAATETKPASGTGNLTITDENGTAGSLESTGGLGGSGIGGGIYYLAGTGQYVIEKSILGMGFNGIPVALLASSNPIGTIFSALFISYIQVGGAAMQPAYSSETIDIVIAVIIYLAAFALLMRGVIAKAVSGRKEKGGAAK